MQYCNATVTGICFANYTETEKEEYCQTMAHAWRRYHGYIPLPLSITECVMTIFFLFAVCRAMQRRKVSRKSYLLIANRALGDLITSATMVIYNTHMIVNDVNNFWLATTSYVALCCLKLFAVVHPFAYIKTVTFKTIVYIVLFSWLIFLLIAMSKLVLYALSNIAALQKWSGCTHATCVAPVDIGHYISAICIYFITVGCFLMTVFFVRRAQKNTKQIVTNVTSKPTVTNDSTSNASKNDVTFSTNSVAQRKSCKQPRFRFSMWKLTLNVGTFVIFNFLYVGYAAYMLIMPRDQHSDCQLNQHFIPHMIRVAVMRCMLSSRIIIDPVISFITDQAIRRSMLALLGWKREGDVTSEKTR